jgi:hypothetical protein
MEEKCVQEFDRKTFKEIGYYEHLVIVGIVQKLVLRK